MKKPPHNHTSTSIAAANSLVPTLAAAEREVYDLFRAHPEGLTTEEAERLLVPRHGSKKHQSVSARVNGLWNQGWLIRTGEKRTNTSGRKAFVYAAKEQEMARKKKEPEAKPEPTTDHDYQKKVMAVFLDQVGAGDSTQGYTFSEMREVMNLTAEDEGYTDVAVAMVALRDRGFLAHKFEHPSLSEDFFVGDPVNIPNVKKRLSGNIRMLVFYVSPMAITITDEETDAAIVSDLVLDPAEFNGPENLTIFTRLSIRDWLESLGELIDLHSNDTGYVQRSAKMIALLLPEAK